MAELHVIGQLVGATDFPYAQLSCKFKAVAGDDWTLLEGGDEGQTQVDLPLVGQNRLACVSACGKMILNDRKCFPDSMK